MTKVMKETIRTMRRRGYRLQIMADFAHAADNIRFREDDGEGDIETIPWRGSCFQVADSSHNPKEALRIVSKWRAQ